MIQALSKIETDVEFFYEKGNNKKITNVILFFFFFQQMSFLMGDDEDFSLKPFKKGRKQGFTSFQNCIRDFSQCNMIKDRN